LNTEISFPFLFNFVSFSAAEKQKQKVQEDHMSLTQFHVSVSVSTNEQQVACLRLHAPFVLGKRSVTTATREKERDSTFQLVSAKEKS
jgi:hypothetical protein